jgi:hypothetical protein
MLYYYIISFVFIIIILYSFLYFIHNEDIVLHQTNIYNFDFSLLHKKQPIIIEDRVKDIESIISSWFAPNIIHKYLLIDEIWKKNNYKYTIIYALYDTEITISHPNTNLDVYDETYPLSTIKLKNNMFIIIPFKWKYNIDNINNVDVFGIHDYITYILDIFRIAQ